MGDEGVVAKASDDLVDEEPTLEADDMGKGSCLSVENTD